LGEAKAGMDEAELAPLDEKRELGESVNWAEERGLLAAASGSSLE
jgi:hypothetical protein